MDSYWTCSECGSSNPYPDAVKCEVCDKIIDAAEKNQAEKKIAENQKIDEQAKRIEQREIKLQKMQELQNQRRHIFEQRQIKKQEKINRILSDKEKLAQRKNKEDKFFKNVGKVVNVLRVCLIVLVIVGMVVVGASIIKHNKIDVIATKVEKIFSEVKDDFVDIHFKKQKSGDKKFKPFINIDNEYKYLKKQIKKSKGIKFIKEAVGG